MARIVVTGINHRTAPVEVRERLACDEGRSQQLLEKLKTAYPMGEFVLLGTCNRVELYAAGEDQGGGQGFLEALAGAGGVNSDNIRPFLYAYKDEQAVRHLFRVAASLDSMVVGEPQINAQVKDAYRLATRAGAAGKVLHRLFHAAFAASKAVYTTTGIAARRVSVAGAAVELARKHAEDLAGAEILVAGTGEMGELLVKHFQQVGCGRITVLSRSPERGRAMAKHLNVAAGTWDELGSLMRRADIMVAAATAQKHLFTRAALAKVLDERSGRPLLIIDIAVPRNVDPAVNVLAGVQLYCIDDLAAIAHENRQARAEEIAQAEAIIDQHVEEFMKWLESAELGPLLGELHEALMRLDEATLERLGREKLAALNMQVSAVSTGGKNQLVYRVMDAVTTIAHEQGGEPAERFIQELLRLCRGQSGYA
ncbi:MAG: glutamyl-tRNA reductase [Sedimentisphaerales bacterium]|nr:glutamyl-tRNA reductase [Sedimentisphaerales bacterium]